MDVFLWRFLQKMMRATLKIWILRNKMYRQWDGGSFESRKKTIETEKKLIESVETTRLTLISNQVSLQFEEKL